MNSFRIADVRAFTIAEKGVGGDYHDRRRATG